MTIFISSTRSSICMYCCTLNTPRLVCSTAKRNADVSFYDTKWVKKLDFGKSQHLLWINTITTIWSMWSMQLGQLNKMNLTTTKKSEQLKANVLKDKACPCLLTSIITIMVRKVCTFIILHDHNSDHGHIMIESHDHDYQSYRCKE